MSVCQPILPGSPLQITGEEAAKCKEGKYGLNCVVLGRLKGKVVEWGIVFKELAPRPYGGGAVERTAQMNILSSQTQTKLFPHVGEGNPTCSAALARTGSNVQRLLPSRGL